MLSTGAVSWPWTGQVAAGAFGMAEDKVSLNAVSTGQCGMWVFTTFISRYQCLT